jgi:Flp pilus assembly protein TadB
MSDLHYPAADLDRRLARLVGALDAAPGFEARLAARLARERAAPDAAARARARDELARAHHEAERVLRRRLRTNLLLIGGATLAAVGPAWLGAQLLASAFGALPGDAIPVLAALSGAAFVAWVGAVLARTARGQPVTALLA